MKEIYLFKLVTGETIIAEQLRVEELNPKTGAKGHILKNPYVVPPKFLERHEKIYPWLPLNDITKMEIPLPQQYEIAIFEEQVVNVHVMGEYLDNVLQDTLN